jgi:hypothetical protein
MWALDQKATSQAWPDMKEAANRGGSLGCQHEQVEASNRRALHQIFNEVGNLGEPSQGHLYVSEEGDFDDYNQALVDWIDRDRPAHNVRRGSPEFRGRANNACHNTRGHCERALRSGLYPPIRPCGLLDCLGGHSNMVRSVGPGRARPHLRLWQ